MVRELRYTKESWSHASIKIGDVWVHERTGGLPGHAPSVTQLNQLRYVLFMVDASTRSKVDVGPIYALAIVLIEAQCPGLQWPSLSELLMFVRSAPSHVLAAAEVMSRRHTRKETVVATRSIGVDEYREWRGGTKRWEWSNGQVVKIGDNLGLNQQPHATH
ncbi:hypothetical protein PENSPDRAFT_671888 [Peniophora sp. CONT]|nr:hypothetical protein PENSPDRAFT_671888 [Peniophora sp. CONT]